MRRRSTGGEVDGISRQLARYVDRIADRWISIAEGNRHKAMSAHPR